MKRVVLTVTWMVCCWVFAGSPVFAAGLGFYGDLAGGGGEAEWDSDFDSFDIDVATGGFGFALDTGPTDGRIFSYRLLAGYEAQVLEDDFGEEMELDGLSMENVFAFGIVRRPELRLWAGPLVRFGFYSGETDTYVSAPGFTARTELDRVFEFGFGGAFGANFRVARGMVLAPSVGFRYFVGGGEGDFVETETSTGITSRYSDDLVFEATTLFVNMTVLFN